MTDPGMTPDVDKQLASLAARLRDNPGFMAYVLAKYEQQERLSDETLAKDLGVTPAKLSRLALCKRPTGNSPQFADQVRQIAAYIGVDAAELARIIRQVDSLETLSQRHQGSKAEEARTGQLQLGRGLLAAARDRTEESENDSSSTSEEESPPEE